MARIQDSARTFIDWIIGERALAVQSPKRRLQSQLAVATALLAIGGNVATIIVGYGLLPDFIFASCFVSLLSFSLVIPIYRWWAPRWSGAREIANNLIAGTLFAVCAFFAIATGGGLTMGAVYASAIPLLSVMICGRKAAIGWSSAMVAALFIAAFVEPISRVQTPPWLTLLSGGIVAVPTLLSMLLHRQIWEEALQSEAIAQRRLKDQHEDQRLLDRRLASFERQESLGLMAGRVAHDLNNLLTALLASADLAKQSATQGRFHEVIEHVQTMKHAAQSGGELSTQLLDYTGKKHHALVPICLSRRLPTAITLAQAASPSETQVSSWTEPNLWVEGDATQLDQVVVNLVRNAAQSYEPKTGEVTVRLAAVEFSEPCKCVSDQVLPPGKYVRLDVRDNGKGIPEDKIERIFEPFYTERVAGRGLGLAAVSGIAAAHGGGIQVAGEENVGATFSLLLPAVSAGEVNEPTVEISNPIENRPGGVVVIADDEPAIREVIGRLLNGMGYGVILAENGQEAVRLFNTLGSITALILDVSMPTMGGHQALGKIRKRDADVPVLLMSGYANTSPQESINDDRTGFLGKPFSPDTLQSRLAELGVGNVALEPSG